MRPSNAQSSCSRGLAVSKVSGAKRENSELARATRAVSAAIEPLEHRQLLSSVPSLDPTFNGTGEVLADWAGGVYATVTGVSVLPSGQIIAVGQGVPTGGTNQELFVARFNSDGSPDNTFNAADDTNYQFYNPFSDGLDDYANGVLQLGDGSFIVSGSNGNEATNLNAKGYIFKFTAAGDLDTSFGSDGAYTDPVQNIYSVVAQGDDLLIGGVAGTTQFAVSRLTADGQLDTSFGTDGRVLFTASAVTAESPSNFSPSGDLSVRDDGSFVYSGVVGPGGSRSGLVANFTAQGTLVPAFGSTSGELLLSYGGDDSAYASLRPDGGLLVEDHQFSGISSITYYVGGISSTGIRTAPLDVGQEDFPNASFSYVWQYGPVVLQSDGDLIEAGLTAGGDSGGAYTSDGYEAALWRTNSTLSALDPTFGSGGEFSLLDDSGGGLFPTDATLTPDGQLLIAGFADADDGSTDSIMLARFDINPGTGNITGSVFDDLNRNGTEDSGEALANVPVYVDLTNAGKYIAGAPITTTDAFGDYSLTGLAPGTYTVRVDLSLLPNLAIESPTASFYSATVAANGTVSGENFALAAPVTAVPPEVTGVSVDSTSWSSKFPYAAAGYAIPTGASQLTDLPWVSLNQVKIKFNEAVNVTQGDLAVDGVNTLTYAISSFSYNATTFTATWTLAAPIGDDKLLLDLFGTGTNAVTAATGGLALDGTWTNGTSTFPSGDDAPGTDFKFDLNVLPGDVKQTGGPVTILDVIAVRNEQLTSAGSAGYSAFDDVDGSGSINILDVIDVRNRQLTALPTGMPTVPVTQARKPAVTAKKKAALMAAAARKQLLLPAINNI